GGQGRISLLREDQVAQFRLQLSFPGVFGATLSHVNGVGGICAIVLAAGAMGSEYGWGTLRTQLARQPDRRRYLLAKVAALLLVLLSGMALGLLVGSALALAFGGALGQIGAPSLGSIVLLPLGMLCSLYVLLPYVLCTLACAILGRSVLAGAAGGFLFLVVDIGLGALGFLGRLGGLVGFLVNLAVQPNVNTLIVLNSQNFGLDPAVMTRTMDLATLPALSQALLVIGCYSALFFAYAYRSFTRRDITGAG
ncbi:MAG TPA: ABC transporter permease subunit, partial [Roseiflexaceae bacterium]|nr:ABC transporter permease subunit [Roseiflexaceae bacterium]